MTFTTNACILTAGVLVRDSFNLGDRCNYRLVGLTIYQPLAVPRLLPAGTRKQ